MAAAEDAQELVTGLVASHGTQLRRFVFARARNLADVPDIVQEVYLRMLRISNVDSIRSPEAYLFTVAQHVVQQHTMRQSATPPAVELAQLLNEPATPRCRSRVGIGGATVPRGTAASARGTFTKGARNFHAASTRRFVVRRNCRPTGDFAPDGQEIPNESLAAFAAASAPGLNDHGTTIQAQCSDLRRGLRMVR